MLFVHLCVDIMSLYLKDWEYCLRTCSSGVEGALLEWLCRRARLLMNWAGRILLSPHTGVPTGLLHTARTGWRPSDIQYHQVLNATIFRAGNEHHPPAKCC